MPRPLASLALAAALYALGEPASGGSAPSPDLAVRALTARAQPRLPLSFEANRGQTDGKVRFLARGGAYTLFLTETEAVLDLGSSRVLRMQLAGASSRPAVEGVDPLSSRSNYFIGNDRAKWRTDVPHFARVRYEEVYPGIDLVYHAERDELEFDFHVAPGTDPGRIGLRLRGARRLELDPTGDLLLRLPGRTVRLRRPVAYQEIGGRRMPICAEYELRGRREAGFRLAAYDRSRPLVIDPVLSYSTFLGGGGSDSGLDIEVDAAGNAYVAGRTLSVNFPTSNPFQGAFGGGGTNGDAFVAKLNPAGSALVYSTYLGGSASDVAVGLAVDQAGNAYVAGSTRSLNFPTANALQGSFGGDQDGFVAKLSPAGNSLLYSTYYGGPGSESFSDVAVDAAGSAHVVGTIPGGGANVNTDAVIAKLNPPGSAFVYNLGLNTSIAGIRLNDFGDGVAVDPAGNAYLGGESGLASIGARDEVLAVAVGPAGQSIYSVTFGGSDDDEARDLAVDSAGNAYITGFTESSNFPTTSGVFQPVRPTGLNGDAFVTKLSPAGAISYSTYLGGIDRDAGNGIAVDASGNAWVAGFTDSSNFPLAGAIQSAYGGMSDAFVAQVNPLGSGLLFSTYLGGSQREIAVAVALDSQGNAYVTGGTSSPAFPTLRAFQAVKSGGEDAFVLRFGEAAPPPGACTPDTTTLCLNNGRFRVQVAWSVPSQGTSGAGQAVALTSDTGYMWFFSANNIELVIKVVDGRAFNGFFWVFYGALSDVSYTITITDTVTGAVKTYTNQQGNLASVADVTAFP